MRTDYLELIDDQTAFEARFAALYEHCVDLTGLTHRMPNLSRSRFQGILDAIEWLRGESEDNPLDRLVII